MASSSEAETASAIRAETITGSHLFKIFGYSMTKGIGVGKHISSSVFTIGGYDWVIKYYPDGLIEDHKQFIAVYLELKSDASDVKTNFSFLILQQNGVPTTRRKKPGSEVTIFNSTTGTKSQSWGYNQFIKRTDFEALKCLKDDAFTLKCTVSVMKGTKLEAINPYGVVVPQSDFKQNLAYLLKSGKGADVTFIVKGEKLDAHRGVLAVRSAVFNAMFFGGMKEKGTDTIIIEDIEAPVFVSMLQFIYSDSPPNFKGNQDQNLIAQHLLVAADRYDLERLRLMCEDVLCKNLSVSNAATTLILAEQHNCNQLKAQCLKFMSSAEVFKEVALTLEFQNLMNVCPSVMKDIKAIKLKCCHS